jgi:enamine deaminase RidA (YjgF/YER057c/UK114 family)
MDASGNLVGKGDIDAQTRQVFENIRRCLEASGATFDHVVKINVYSTDVANHAGAIRKVRREYFTTEAVPSTTVQIPCLVHPDCLVEIEAIAILD